MTTRVEGGFVGTGALMRLVLRRDRVRLPVWVLGISAVTYLSGSAMGRTFPTQASIDAYAASVGGSPTVVALSGPPIGLDTIGGVVLSKVASIAVLGVGLMAVLQVVRHSRAEEEEGRTELLRSTVVGRHAGDAAAVLTTSLASIALGAGIALALAGASLPGADAVLYGASIAAIGIVFSAITLCLAQAFTHARTATGAGIALLGLAYVIRAIGDVNTSWVVWLSPIGWAQATHPLGERRWWPLAVCLAASAALVWLAVLLARHRDTGGGLIAGRAGHARASRWLAGPVGLAFRLQAGMVAAWAGGFLVLGAVIGSLSNAVGDMANGNPTLVEYLRATGHGSMVDAYVATMLLVQALAVSGFAVSSAMRLASEERAGRLEPLLATGLSRTRWLLGSLLVTTVGSVLVLLAGGLGLGAAYAVTTSEPGSTWSVAWDQLIYLPAVLVSAALAVALLGWVPRWTNLAWGVLSVYFVLGWLGGLIHPPDLLQQLSPFHHVPAVPVEAVSVAAPLLTLLVVTLLTGVGVVGLRRRDVE